MMAVDSEPSSSYVSLIGWMEIILVLILLVLYVYYTWTSAYKYWKRRNVPYLKPKFPFGNVSDLFLMRKNFRDSWLDLYNRLEDNPFGGIFSLKTPVMIIKDPKLIKMMLTKDFIHFIDRNLIANNDHEPLIRGIFFMEGELWRKMRMKLVRAFTSLKMKMMFSIMNDCSDELKLYLKNIQQNKGTLEAKDLMARFMFDTVVSCTFGLKPTALNNAHCELYMTGKRMDESSLWRSFSTIIGVEAPQLYNLFKIHLLQYDACKSFINIIKETIEFREKHNIIRNDFLGLLIRIKNNTRINEKNIHSSKMCHVSLENDGNSGKSEEMTKGMTLDAVLCQIIGVFIGGFEASASALAFCLYELARNPYIQIKIQRELDEAYERRGNITYQMLQELPYIDNVISEALRMYSTLPMLNRVCVKAYRIPDSEVVIEKGCKVIIPSYAIHHDPKYYPDPFKFDPDRFLEENVRSRPAYTFLSFGEGPRMCTGMRFAKMQMRLALATLFSEFNLTLNPQTPVPLTIGCGVLLTATRDPILIDLCDRDVFSISSCKL